MQAKGISLRCELSRVLPPRLSGPTPLLRHALDRALLAVTAPVRGGMACIRASRDPNAPKSLGVVRVFFSISWTLFARNVAIGAQNSANKLENQDCFVTFEALADPDGGTPDSDIDLGVLEMADEQEVLRYLAQRMRGDLLEGTFSNDFRAISIIIPLAYLSEDVADGVPREQAAENDETPSASGRAGDFADQGIAPLKDGRYANVAMAALAAEREPPALGVLSADDPSASPEYAKGEEAPDPGLDILLVEDNLNNRLLFSLFLRDTRHRISEAHDGQAGVEAFLHGQFDVIFLDMEMPLMNGYQATRIIRALEAENGRPATPIVAMTSYALPEFQRQCMLAGCTDFMSKPFNKITLTNMLDALRQMKAHGPLHGRLRPSAEEPGGLPPP
jgi:CheY-like chemotaxis protein